MRNPHQYTIFRKTGNWSCSGKFFTFSKSRNFGLKILACPKPFAKIWPLASWKPRPYALFDEHWHGKENVQISDPSMARDWANFMSRMSAKNVMDSYLFSIHSSWDWRVLQEQGCVVNGMLCRSKRSLSMPICRNFGHPRLAANRAPYVHPPYPPQHRPTIVLWSEKFAYHGMIMESLVSLTWIASVCSSPRGVSTFMLWATMCHTSKGMVPVPMDRQKLKDRITPHVNFFQ